MSARSRELAYLLGHLGANLLDAGRYAEALGYLEQARAIAAEVGDDGARCEWAGQSALARARAGRIAAAVADARETFALAGGIRDSAAAAHACTAAGESLLRARRLDEADRCYAFAIARAGTDPWVATRAAYGRSLLLEARGRAREAAAALRQAHALGRRTLPPSQARNARKEWQWLQAEIRRRVPARD